MTALAEGTPDMNARSGPAGPRILFVSPAAYPLGGVADWLDYALSGLTDQGHGCHLALVDGGGHDPARYLSRHPWPDVVVVRNPTGSREGRVAALAQAITAAAPDLVLSINLVDVYEAVRRIRLEARAGVAPRVAMTLHGLQADLVADIADHRDVLDGVVATNRLACRLAVDALGDATRVCYAPYGVPAAGGLYPLARDAGRRGLRLLYAGRIEQEQKRVLDLPGIVSGIVERDIDATLSIAGAGPMEAELRQACSAAGVDDRVNWLGALDPSALKHAYRTHDALLITSAWETGPIVAWEAMSHGLPVVSSRYVGSAAEAALVDGCNARLFPVGNIGAAVDAAAALLDPAERARVVAGGLDLVVARYTQQASVQAWAGAIDAILAMPTLPSPVRARPTGPSGRLDRLFGVRHGERVRRLLGIGHAHDAPGSAWPHTGNPTADSRAFEKRASLMDVEAGVPGPGQAARAPVPTHSQAFA
jgi:glycosyltransferase involved in cell wall biosynthesis